MVLDIAALLNDLLDASPCLGANARKLIKHFGDGSGRDASLSGYLRHREMFYWSRFLCHILTQFEGTITLFCAFIVP